MLLKNLELVRAVLAASAMLAAGVAALAPGASAVPRGPTAAARLATASDPPPTDGTTQVMNRVNTAAAMFGRLVDVREDIEYAYKHLQALSSDPTDREAARQLRARLLCAQDALKAIHDNVDRIAVEPRPKARLLASTPPRTPLAKSDDLERRLREVESKLHELLDARSKGDDGSGRAPSGRDASLGDLDRYAGPIQQLQITFPHRSICSRGPTGCMRTARRPS
jgi:hypothetical protein